MATHSKLDCINKASSIKVAREDIKAAIRKQGVSVPDDLVLSGIPPYIISIGGAPLEVKYVSTNGVNYQVTYTPSSQFQGIKELIVSVGIPDDKILIKVPDEEVDNLDWTIQIVLDSTGETVTYDGYLYGSSVITTLDFPAGTIKSLDLDSSRNLTTVEKINLSGLTELKRTFYECNSLVSLPDTLDTSDCTRFSETFAYCKNLVTSPKINTSKATLFGWMYKDCTKLQSVPVLDCSNVQQWLGNFDNCTSLTTVGGFTNLGKSLIESNHNSNYSGIGFNNCPLTRASARNIFNGLYDIRNSEHLSNYPSYRKIHFSATTFDSLRDDDIAIAANKGWTVVRGI